MRRRVTKHIAVIIASLSLGACSAGPLRRVTVEMMWQQGAIGQKDRASLHFQKGLVDCSLNFYDNSSLKYIERFRSVRAPVVFDVSYMDTGKPFGATLVRVGEWNASRFQPNERFLATTEVMKLGNAEDAGKTNIDSPGGCFDPVPAIAQIHIPQQTTIILLLLICANFGLGSLGLIYGHHKSSEEHPSRTASLLGTTALAMAGSSQILFLAYAAAGRFAWVRFYPGNPIQTSAILIGVILCCGALVTALFGSGLRRVAGALVAVITAGLWLIAAVASVSV